MNGDVRDPQVEKAEALEELQHALVLADVDRRDRARERLAGLEREARDAPRTSAPSAEGGWAWTNESVKPLLAFGDPVDVIVDRARQMTLAAMTEGWGTGGPPYDPIALADLLNIEVRPTQELEDADAQLVVEDGRPRINFNPVRPKNRRRFSLAHELAHTLFEDYASATRHRLVHGGLGDEWQLETLCNAAAAEILMPTGSFEELVKGEPSIEHFVGVRQEFGVSTEAALNRYAHLTDLPVMSFAVSADGRGHRIDYAVASKSWPVSVQHWRRLRVPMDSVFQRCNAIGHTAKSDTEAWLPGGRVECIGLPPYRGFSELRMAGIALLPVEGGSRVRHFEEVLGDATRPVGTGGATAVAMVVNDKAKTWKGAFANAVRRRWPNAQREYQDWVEDGNLAVGGVCRIQTDDATLFAMVAQKGYGASVRTRLRYEALRVCLRQVGTSCEEAGLSLHIPRIGGGEARGDWHVISELITDEVSARGVPVTVYLPPGQRADSPAQVSLFAGG